MIYNELSPACHEIPASNDSVGTGNRIFFFLVVPLVVDYILCRT